MKIESLETKLRESHVKSNEMNNQWEDKYAAANRKCADFEEELDQLKASKQASNLPSREHDIGEANISKMMDTLAEKEEELRRLNEEVGASNDSLQKQKGTFYIALSFPLQIFYLS